MSQINQFTITDAVKDSFRTEEGSRFKFLLETFIDHLHDFTREVNMTHDDIISFFGSNKAACERLNYKKTTISMTRVRRVSSEIQIRAHHVSRGVLKLDDEAQKYLNFLLAKDRKKAA